MKKQVSRNIAKEEENMNVFLKNVSIFLFTNVKYVSFSSINMAKKQENMNVFVNYVSKQQYRKQYRKRRRR